MKTVFLISAIVWFIGTLNWDIFTDKKKFDSGDYFFNHKKDWWLRLLVISPAIVLFSFATNNFIWSLPASGLMIGFWYWFLFDGLYNEIVLKRDFLELVGTTSSLDKFQQHIGSFGSFLIKTVGIILFTTVYIIL